MQPLKNRTNIWNHQQNSGRETSFPSPWKVRNSMNYNDRPNFLKMNKAVDFFFRFALDNEVAMTEVNPAAFPFPVKS